NLIFIFIYLLLFVIQISLIKSKYKKTWIFILLSSGMLLGAMGAYNLMAYMAFDPSLDTQSQTDSIIRISIPMIGSIITAFSVILATQNANVGEKSAKRTRVLDLVKFTTDIIKDDEINKKSIKILKQLESVLKSNKTRLDILVNNGAHFCYDYLNKGENRKNILAELNKLNYEVGSIYDEKQQELKALLQSNNLKDMRKLWILINYLAGSPAVKHGILSEKKEYELDNEWIGKGLRKHKFYYDSVLKDERQILRGLIIAHANHDYQTQKIKYEEIFRVCNQFFESKYDELGHFFRTTHRTLKLINQYYGDEPEEHKMQIGLFRAQIPNTVAMVLFYNAFFTEPGRGMGREMIASSLYGNADDFKFNLNNNHKHLIKAQHFYDKDRFLSDQNAYICATLLTQSDKSKKASNDLKKIYKKQKLKKAVLKLKNLFISKSEHSYLKDEIIEYNFSKEESFLHNLFKSHFEENSVGYPEQFKIFIFDKPSKK
ncbi:putative phage abortive infection protein, partial [Lysinibacillus sp. CNPSo 3705]|uniref:putative phage abortive infection protein n=1 Tax=Lysinibacillus sp. CNPSo 3705 TaxID=3028148 RepID=UPI002363A142